MSVPLSRIIREEDSLYPLLTKLNSNKIEYARVILFFCSLKSNNDK